jgi:class III poly(R)-hydroxyalkanoic acid synthase PhaE subunit
VDPAEYMRSLTELWSRGGKDLIAAQQAMFFDMARRMANRDAKDALATPQVNFLDPQELMKASEAFAKMWASANELSQTLTRSMQQGEKHDPLVMGVLGKVFDPRAWLAGTGGMDETLQKMAEGPRLADLWDTERKMLNVFNAWTALRRRSLEHNSVMLEAWMQAAGKFAKDLNARAERNETLSSWRELLALWVETANTTMLETQRSDAYLKSQREILNASTNLRLAQQEVAAFYSEMFGYPTRAELDDVHRTVTELRRELRAAQRANRTASRPASETQRVKPAKHARTGDGPRRSTSK